ncbi:MAG: dTDP-4-dehydrorhamnose reductase [Chitinophagales bacterium]
MKKTILVTGANGQLGQSLQMLQSTANENIEWLFCGRKELDITDNEAVTNYFEKNKIDVLFNCAAYTQVDRAENEEEKAYQVNAEACKYLAEACHKNDTLFVHISTDFVFDGTKGTPYKTNDKTKALGIYGKSKLRGEQYVQDLAERYVIIRTAWVYSPFLNNFVKTMRRLGNARAEIGVVYDQIGSPTYAVDLAATMIEIQEQIGEKQIAKTYHFSNQGIISWFDFATNIMKLSNLQCKVKPIETHEYPTPAHRPSYSVLWTRDIQNDFGLNISYWSDSLEKCIQILEK